VAVGHPLGHRTADARALLDPDGGGGQAKLDNELVDVRAWDALRIAPDVMRAFAAGPDGLEYLAFGAPAVEQPMADVETEQGWWKR
jgi:hypothetical protein